MSEQVKYNIDSAERTFNYLLKKKEARILKFISKGDRQTEAEKEYVNDERKLIDVTKYLVYEYKNISLGKMPPQAVELEISILGAIILESKSPHVESVMRILRPDHFYSEEHNKIYTVIQEMYTKQYPIDMHTVVGQLRKKGWIESIGGAYYIAQLTAGVNSAANLSYHAHCIIEYAIKRYLIMVGQRILIEGYSDEVDGLELLDAIIDRVQLIKTENVDKFKSIQQNG